MGSWGWGSEPFASESFSWHSPRRDTEERGSFPPHVDGRACRREVGRRGRHTDMTGDSRGRPPQGLKDVKHAGSL